MRSLVLASASWKRSRAWLSLAFLTWGCGARVEALKPEVAPKPVQQTSAIPAAPEFLVGQFPPLTVGPHLLMVDSRPIAVSARPGGSVEVRELSDADRVLSEKEKSEALFTTPRGAYRLELRAIPGGLIGALLASGGEADQLQLFQWKRGLGLVGSLVEELPSGSLLWVGLFPDQEGASVVVARRSQDAEKGGAADLFLSHLSASFQRKAPEKVASSVLAWQVSRSPSLNDPRLVIATLLAGKEGRELWLMNLGRDGARKERSLAQGLMGGLDLDLASGRQEMLLALSLKEGPDSRVHRVVLDDLGEVRHPLSPLTAPERGQRLSAILESQFSAEPWVIWTEADPKQGRRVMLGHAAKEPISSAHVWPTRGPEGARPLLAEDPRGIWGLSKACADDPCTKSSAALLRFDAEQKVVRASRLDGSKMGAVLWDPVCSSVACYALKNQVEGEVTLLRLDDALLEATGALGASAATPRLPVISDRALIKSPELSQLKVLPERLSFGVRSFTLSAFDEGIPYEKPTQKAPDGKLLPVRAVLSTQSLTGKPNSPSEQVISYRARSISGFGVSETPNGEVYLIWTALDQGSPQIFLTLLDDKGKKKRQELFRRKVDELGEVAIVNAGERTFIAWAETSGGAERIFMAAISGELKRADGPWVVAEDVRDPTGLTLARHADGKISLAWSDAKRSTDAFGAEIRIASIDPAERVRFFEPAWVTPEREAGHSHSPTWIGGHRDRLAWLVQMDAETPAPYTRLVFGKRDGSGRVRTEAELRLPRVVHSFSARDDGEALLLAVVEDQPVGGSVSLARIPMARGTIEVAALKWHLLLHQTERFAVAAELAGDHLIYLDRDSGGQHWLRDLVFRREL